MTWLQKLLPPRIKRTPGDRRTPVPEGLWVKCPSCEAVLYRTDLENNLFVCPKCGHHQRVPARERIEQLLDPEGRFEIGSEVVPIDSLKFKDQKKYPDRLAAALEETGETDALVVMQGSVKSVPLVVGAFEFEFMGGSMGSVVGERFARGVRVAYENRVPFVCVSASGGARMQEGVSSLFQMAKTTAVLQELNKARLPFVSILTDPTMGGVSASFAFVADLVIAEPGALIGFAGPRVIEQTVREKLPEGFQRAEFLMEKGALDLIVDRRQLRDELARLLALLTRQPAAFELTPPATLSGWLAYLETLHPKAIALGLDRVRAVLARLPAPIACPVVTVGGTNGKGSTCAMIEAIARRAGYRTGLYASPHLLRYNERVRIDGVEADDAALVEAFDAVEAARADVPLTYFEFGTLAALWLFARAKPDVLILEVGPGRAPRRGECRGRRCRGADEHRHRPRRLPRPHARGHRTREGGHLPRRPSRDLRGPASAGDRPGRSAGYRREPSAARSRLRLCRRAHAVALPRPARRALRACRCRRCAARISSRTPRRRWPRSTSCTTACP